MTELPGRELSKEWREVVAHQVTALGWRYERGRKHHKLYPADATQRPLIIPGSASDHRALRNFITAVRRAGGVWPPRGGRA